MKEVDGDTEVTTIDCIKKIGNHFFVGCFTCAPDNFEASFVVHMAQILTLGVQLLSRETLLQVKNSTGRRWVSNPSPCR